MRDLLNRINCRVKRMRKGTPLEKTPESDAFFANVKQVRGQAGREAEPLEISVDAKAKVAPGDYVRGGKARTDSGGEVPKGWDHDPPAKRKLVPFGILMGAPRALIPVIGARDTSDARGDAWKPWWLQVRGGLGHVKRLVLYQDNGPKNSGRRTQFLRHPGSILGL